MQSLEDVIDCLSGETNAVWFSSSDESAAKEYILYCAEWVEKLITLCKSNRLHLPAGSSKFLKTREIKFTNNSRINALSSNPNAFRSKGGKICIDEFSHHKSDTLLWKAAKPCITWGYPLRILSTHNGRNSLYFKFIEGVNSGRLNWNLHRTDVYTAVQEGICNTIFNRSTTEEEQKEWLNKERADCNDDVVWLEEYCCIPSDEKTAFIPFAMLQACYGEPVLPAPSDELYAGVDIGRLHDLTVIWRLIKKGNIVYTVDVTCLKNEPFHRQREILFELIGTTGLRRVCIDATGIGMQLAEETEVKFGKAKTEKIHFTAPVKEELAYGLKRRIEERSVIIPGSAEIAEDIHSVRKSVTIAGNFRFTGESSANGHADRFWALALALHAAGSPVSSEGVLLSTGRSSRGKMLKGFL